MPKSLEISSNRPNKPDAQYYEFEEIRYPYAEIREFPLLEKVGLERYLPLLPIEAIRCSLFNKEGITPLTLAKKLGAITGLHNLYIKGEQFNPTGCFKDRESVVVISVACERRTKEVYVVSSGNAALSTAAYAKKAGIVCTCYVPEKTSKCKKDLIKLFGANLVEMPGLYENVYRQVVKENPPGWNVTTGQNGFRIEGGKTIAFEIWEQMGIPDTIVVPCGNGGCLAAIWKGFKELQIIGKISHLPQMVAVQIKGAAPLAVALKKKRDFAVLEKIDDNIIAEGIVAQESYASPKATKALRESGGYVVEVSNNEVIIALNDALQELVICEPTSAAVFAAAKKLKNKPSDRVVLINTGSGFKCLPTIVELIT